MRSHPAALARLAWERAGVGLAVVDAGYRLRLVNARFLALVGADGERSVGRRLDDRLPVLRTLGTIPATPDTFWQEIELAGMTARLGVGILDDQGHLLLTLVAEAPEALEAAAPLREPLARAIVRAERQQQPLGVLLVALECPAGQAASPALLAQVARRLRGTLREADRIACLGEGRWGVLIEHPVTPASLRTLCLRLQEAMDPPFEKRELVALSIGIARYPEEGQEADDLLQQAEQALAEARRRGPGHFAFRDRGLGRHLERQSRFLAELQEALLFPDRHFRLVYQPQLDPLSGTCLGLEAYVRWAHPRLGVVYPVELLAAADELGQPLRLDRWVLERVLEQRAAWVAAGWIQESFRISVNLSGAALEQEVFDGRPLDHFLRQRAERLGWLCLEVPLAELAALGSRQCHHLKRVQRLAVSLAVDGLDLRPISLPGLAALGVSRAKLAPALLDALEGTVTTAAGVQALVAALHALGIETVATGVECERQLVQAKTLGVALVQGHRLVTPLDAQGLEEWFASRAAGSG